MIEIDTSEKFPHLPKAPIVEAAIQWHAAPSDPFDPQRLHEALKDKLPEYPLITPQVEIKVEHHVSPESSKSSQNRAWQAFQVGK